MQYQQFPHSFRRLAGALAVAALAILTATAPAMAQSAPLEGSVQGDAGQAIAGATVTASPAAPADSFEQDFDGWQFRQDIQGLSTADRTTEVAFDGSTSVVFSTTGRFDDGTAWLQKTFFLDPSTTYQVHLSWYQTNLFTSDIGRWPVVAYAGTTAPQEEADFTEVGRDSASESFTRYDLDTTVTTDSSGQVVLAFGVSVVFEVDRAHFFDFVRPSIVPLSEIETTTTDAAGDFGFLVEPGIYRVEAEADGFLPAFTVPVDTGSDEPTLTLVKQEDIWASDFRERLVTSNDEKLFVFVTLATPTGVRVDGAQCLARLELADGTSDFLQTVSENGTCTFRYTPFDGTVTRGPALFELNDVEAEGKTYTPSMNVVQPFKFTVD